ncbi:unannotated protein [freshwater metagenome]|uniref:Unannotated protein n=1 Tax=freshwater metagenome TaxID=449393 RepID=A0A6J7GLL1_9ZZZZ
MSSQYESSTNPKIFLPSATSLGKISLSILTTVRAGMKSMTSLSKT